MVSTLTTDPDQATREPVAAKVPEIAVIFWVIKILTTGMGEAFSDYLGGVNLVLAGGVGFLGFVLALRWQLRTDRYVAPIYWFAVMMVAVFGTMVADVLHVGLDLPYAVTVLLYACAVAACFVLWHRSEGTLSIHSITTRRRENFYWATVLATFALGTALGDFSASELGLGFFASGLIYTALIAIPLIGWKVFKLNEVATFWAAYVLTRPLGASFADWIGKPPALKGLAFGDGGVSAVAFVAIAALVAYVAITKRDLQKA